MDKEKIVDYVMETPANSNPAVLRSMLEQLPSGDADVPDPSELADGSALVVVDGEYKVIEGYAYTRQAEEEEVTITWDGSTNGKPTFSVQSLPYYKFHNYIPVIGDTVHEEGGGQSIDTTITIINSSPAVYRTNLAIFAEEAGTYTYVNEFGESTSVTIPEAGIYSMWVNFEDLGPVYLTSAVFTTLAAPVVPFDESLIPNNKVIVNLTYNEDGDYEADKTAIEINELIESGKEVVLRWYSDSPYEDYYYNLCSRCTMGETRGLVFSTMCADSGEEPSYDSLSIWEDILVYTFDTNSIYEFTKDINGN